MSSGNNAYTYQYDWIVSWIDCARKCGENSQCAAWTQYKGQKGQNVFSKGKDLAQWWIIILLHTGYGAFPVQMVRRLRKENAHCNLNN